MDEGNENGGGGERKKMERRKKEGETMVEGWEEKRRSWVPLGDSTRHHLVLSTSGIPTGWSLLSRVILIVVREECRFN